MTPANSASETHNQGDRNSQTCVFCKASPLVGKFTKLVMGKYPADFMQCPQCGSLQIPVVHWLCESYGRPELDMDTGSVQRSILCSLYIKALRNARLIGRKARIIDFGTGSGLLVRLLRDQDFQAFGYDPYVSPIECAGFALSSLDSFDEPADLITAIEVFEHLTQPAETIGNLLGNLSANGLILLRTGLYDQHAHGPQWQYLGCEHGQHINFPTRIGLQAMGKRLELAVSFLPFGFQLLTRPQAQPGPLRKATICALAGLYFAAARAVGLCRFDHSFADSQLLAQKQHDQSAASDQSGEQRGSSE